MKNTEKTEQKVKRGRPVNPNSARQSRVTKWESLRANGVEVKRGRPKKVTTEAATVASK